MAPTLPQQFFGKCNQTLSNPFGMPMNIVGPYVRLRRAVARLVLLQVASLADKSVWLAGAGGTLTTRSLARMAT